MSEFNHLNSPDTKAVPMGQAEAPRPTLARVVAAMSGSDLEALDGQSDVSVSIADAEVRDNEGMTVAFKVLPQPNMMSYSLSLELYSRRACCLF